MARQFRRVVTGHDENGLAIIESDQTATHTLQRPNRPGVTLTNFWLSDSTPAEYDGATETCEGPFVLHPSKNGSSFRCVEFLPEDPDVLATLDGKSAFAEMGAGNNIVENARHPFMHRTNSLDYAIILSGEIYMLMDDEKDDVLLKTGDVVIQRGTNHAWSNKGTEPCVIVFVLVDGVTQKDAALEDQIGIPPR